MFIRNGVFETVLNTNKEYIEAVNTGARAEVQENLLKQCGILLRTMILDAGLATSYKDYCDEKKAKLGRLFD